MNEVLNEKEKLINNSKTAILATSDNKGIPNSSYCPIYIDEDSNYYIYISELSKHTINISSNPIISLMIIEDESHSENIFARKRFTIDGECSKINRDTKIWNQKIEKMEAKFGETFSYLKSMKDFHLFKIVPQNGLLVYGFGKAFKITGSKLDCVMHINDKGHKN